MRKRDEKKNQRETMKALAMILQIGMTMMICLGISLGIGFYIDKLFGTKFWIIIMMVIGILASLRSMLILTGVYHPGRDADGDDGAEKGQEDESSQD